ncbi:MAG: hypothetical protein ABIK09_16035 [Pseudomonadota bacterium]
MVWIAVSLVVVGCLVGALLGLFLSGGIFHYRAEAELSRERTVETGRYSFDVDAITKLPKAEQELVLAHLGAELEKKIEPALAGPRRLLETRLPLRRASLLLSMGTVPFMGALSAEPLRQHLFPVHPLPLIVVGLAGLLTAIFIPGISVSAFAILASAAWALATFGAETSTAFFGPTVQIAGMEFYVVYAAPLAWLAFGISTIVLSGRRAGAIGLAVHQGRSVSWQEQVTPTKPSYSLSGYQCGACRGSLPGKVAMCPHCGVRFGGTRSIYDKPPPGPVIVKSEAWPATRSARIWIRSVVLPTSTVLVATVLLGGPWGVKLTLGGITLGLLALIFAHTRSRGRALAGTRSYGDVTITNDIGTYDHNLGRKQVLAKYGRG